MKKHRQHKATDSPRTGGALSTKWPSARRRMLLSFESMTPHARSVHLTCTVIEAIVRCREPPRAVSPTSFVNKTTLIMPSSVRAPRPADDARSAARMRRRYRTFRDDDRFRGARAASRSSELCCVGPASFCLSAPGRPLAWCSACAAKWVRRAVSHARRAALRAPHVASRAAKRVCRAVS
jgi:hypothetical protein